MTLPFALTIIVSAVIYWLFTSLKVSIEVKKNRTPISMAMAVHHENAKFRIRYSDLEPNQELYKLGLRSGQYGVVLKHKSGTYAKTTVNGKCRFVPIQSCNYIPQLYGTL